MTDCGASSGAFADYAIRRVRWSVPRRRDVVRALQRSNTMGCRESVGTFPVAEYAVSQAG